MLRKLVLNESYFTLYLLLSTFTCDLPIATDKQLLTFLGALKLLPASVVRTLSRTTSSQRYNKSTQLQWLPFTLVLLLLLVARILFTSSSNVTSSLTSQRLIKSLFALYYAQTTPRSKSHLNSVSKLIERKETMSFSLRSDFFVPNLSQR